MQTDDEIAVEKCRELLKRAAWRIQHSTRLKRTKECQMFFADQAYQSSFETEILSRIFVESLLASIPYEKCRYIIKKTIIEGVSEKEVAYQLNMTQQGVNKWKKRGLEIMKKYLTNSYKQ